MADKTKWCIVLVLIWTALSATQAAAFHSHLKDAGGKYTFPREFANAYREAADAAVKSKTTAPLHQMLNEFTQPNEQAELELTLGIIYVQQAGLVDYAKAIEHLTNALEYDLAEQDRVAILLWRGNALERVRGAEAALQDYLRGVLICSYHRLPARFPEVAPPSPSLDLNSRDAADRERIRDYRDYQRAAERQRFLIRYQFNFLQEVRRIKRSRKLSDADLRKRLKELTLDRSRYKLILSKIDAEPQSPWEAPASAREP